MRARHWFIAFGLVSVAACAAGNPVARIESNQIVATTIAPTTSQAPTTTTTVAPTNAPGSTAPDTTAPEQPDVELVDRVRFDLPAFDIELRFRPTLSEPPPGGYSGFQDAVELGDGSFVASGFDDTSSAGSPERSAVWASPDGITWTRVGVAISDGLGQQTVASLFNGPDGRPRALVTGVAPGPDGIEFGSTAEWGSDDGTSWEPTEPVGNGFYSNTIELDDRVIAFGSDSPNTEDEFTASTAQLAWGESVWTTVAVAPDDAVAGAVLVDVVEFGDALIATGATAAADQDGRNSGTLFETLTAFAPGDLGLWRSTDGGDTWQAITASTFVARSAPAIGTRLAVVDEALFLSSATSLSGVTVADLHRSDDAGDTWTRVPFNRASQRPEVDSSTVLGTSGVFAVHGALVMVEERFTAFSQDMFMTVIDPDTGDAVTEHVTGITGLNQVEHIMSTSRGVWGFGRVDRPLSESDLQVVEFERFDG